MTLNYLEDLRRNSIFQKKNMSLLFADSVDVAEKSILTKEIIEKKKHQHAEKQIVLMQGTKLISITGESQR